MSQAPHVARGLRWGAQLGKSPVLEDLLWESLKDPIPGISMAETAEELASDAVFDGFVYFRDRGLLGRQWSVEHGQPLNEYFVNACVLEAGKTCPRAGQACRFSAESRVSRFKGKSISMHDLTGP